MDEAKDRVARAETGEEALWLLASAKENVECFKGLAERLWAKVEETAAYKAWQEVKACYVGWQARERLAKARVGELAVKLWENGDRSTKKLLGGLVTIRESQVPIYDMQAATQYALDHGIALMLDKKAFDAYVKGADLSHPINAGLAEIVSMETVRSAAISSKVTRDAITPMEGWE